MSASARLAISLVDEAQARHAARRRDDNRLAERRGMEAISEDEIVAPVVARRQRLVGDEQVVQAARAGEADVISRVEHARRIAQQFPSALDGDRLQEGFGREAGPALEDVLEVRRRKADMACDRLDRRLIAIAPGDELDRALDSGVIGASGREGRECRAWPCPVAPGALRAGLTAIRALRRVRHPKTTIGEPAPCQAGGG